MLNVGDQAPGFAVVDHTGAIINLNDYADKTVVLWCYPRASTGG